LSVWWENEEIGTVYINSLDPSTAGNGWDVARYDVTATGEEASLSLASTTKEQSSLVVTDVHLYDLSAPLPSSLPPSPPPSPPPSRSWRVPLLLTALGMGVVLCLSLLALGRSMQQGRGWAGRREGGRKGYKVMEGREEGRVVELPKTGRREGGEEEVLYQAGVVVREQGRGVTAVSYGSLVMSRRDGREGGEDGEEEEGKGGGWSMDF
jgi:hypothetical protein